MVIRPLNRRKTSSLSEEIPATPPDAQRAHASGWKDLPQGRPVSADAHAPVGVQLPLLAGGAHRESRGKDSGADSEADAAGQSDGGQPERICVRSGDRVRGV